MSLFASSSWSFIFPQFSAAFEYGEHKTELYQPLNISKTPNKSDIDIPQSLAHMGKCAFPTQDWGPVSIRMFEKDGAFSLPRHQNNILHNQALRIGQTPEPGVNRLLLTQQFLTALLWEWA
ncbi:hypothetical protein DFH09DRAFT_1069395 [Mycena vulgaris]|nr:hypothetical protein DFH09DRAFT_1069395 [Mycena vulgaris]